MPSKKNRKPASQRQTNNPQQQLDEFQALYESCSRPVWSVAYNRWQNPDDANDITQEAFLRLWEQWEAGVDIANPRAWLLRVARNLAEDHAKSANKRKRRHNPPALEDQPAREMPPDKEAVREELLQAVWQTAETLPDPERVVFHLKYGEGLTDEEISDVTGWRRGTVWWRLNCARNLIRQRLEHLRVADLVAP